MERRPCGWCEGSGLTRRTAAKRRSKTNPVPRPWWRRRRTNGALLSGRCLGLHRNPSATRLSPDLNGPVGRSCLAKSQALGLTRSAGLPADVQSVVCGAASNPNSGLEENSEGDDRIRPEPNRLINREVPVDGLAMTCLCPLRKQHHNRYKYQVM